MPFGKAVKIENSADVKVTCHWYDTQSRMHLMLLFLKKLVPLT